MFKENEIVRLKKEVTGDVMGEDRKYILPHGTIASVVAVYGSLNNPEAYEIEVYVEETNVCILATVAADDVQ